MPPQPGVFAVPYKSRSSNHTDVSDMPYNHHTHHAVAGPSSRPHGSIDDGKKERRRKELAGRVGREIGDRRDDGRAFSDTVAALRNSALQIAARPGDHPLYALRLYPLSLERSALLAQFAAEERTALASAQTAHDAERARVEEEWRLGRDRVRERLLEGIEERRRRARDEKEGEGTAGDAALDAQSRPHITRKLRNKLGTSPPPTPLGTAPAAALAVTSGPFLNPHSLSVDELPSPFPLPLTAVAAVASGGAAVLAGTGTTARRRVKGGGTHAGQAIGGLGKSLAMLAGGKESEIENDLGEIRRGNKRRRAAAVPIKT